MDELTNKQSQFTLPGAAERNAGMAQVEENATLDTKRAVKWAIFQTAKSHHPTTQWTTDAVHALLEEWGITMNDKRLLGPLMRSAEVAGLIERVMCPTCDRQETTYSSRPERHRGPQYLWRTKA